MKKGIRSGWRYFWSAMDGADFGFATGFALAVVTFSLILELLFFLLTP